MAKYANGNKSQAISDRSGMAFPYQEMVTEWNGFKVGPDEFEPKHPQLGPIRVGPDPQALHDPRPRSTLDPVTVRFPTFDLVSLQFISLSFAKTEVGSVTISGAVTSITVEPTSVTAQTFIGNISVVISGAASRFDSTNVTLDTSNKTFDEG